MPTKASYEPTPEDIAEATARIRAKWRKDRSRRQVVEADEDEQNADQSAKDEKASRREVFGYRNRWPTV